MMCQVFISHANQDEGTAAMVRDHLSDYGVRVWMYAYDKTVGDHNWSEIEGHIRACRVFLFVVSSHTSSAQGQRRELEIALSRLKTGDSRYKIIPLLLGDLRFSSLPDEIRYINGFDLGTTDVKVVALQIVRQFLPELIPQRGPTDWHFPKPGQWLKVGNLDRYVAEDFDLGDPVYFRRISPIGLFECFAPKINNLCWFLPQNLMESELVDENGTYTLNTVPERYRTATMLDIERLGLEEYDKQKSSQV